ncbi:Uncharacterised protein [Staphylococcus aureus]|nr:Uncharacterised protein [Staphylococcus aureus]
MLPQVERISPIIFALWKVIIVSIPAIPGMIPLGPPENPAKKCGSIKPVTILKSASTYDLFRYTSHPYLLCPTLLKVVLSLQ